MNELDTELTRSRVHSIMTELNRRDKQLAIKYNLTPSLAQLFLLLVDFPFVTMEIYIASSVMKTDIKTAMMRLRKRLAKHEITIESNRDVGYWLDEETKNGIFNKSS